MCISYKNYAYPVGTQTPHLQDNLLFQTALRAGVEATV